jgi:phospholipid transport system substrate-binding protein
VTLESRAVRNSARALLTGLLLGLALLGPVGASTPDMASALVKDTTDRMLQVLQQRRAELDAKPQLIYDLVDKIVVPNFDFERITQYAMGRYWRQASQDQRTSLISEFQHLLVRTYARALLNYSGQKVRILPLRPGNREGQITVRTKVNQPGGSSVPIEYQMHLKGGAWKVYDVIIDGVSLVANYRSSFAEEIRRGGIARLIETLKRRNQGDT